MRKCCWHISTRAFAHDRRKSLLDKGRSDIPVSYDRIHGVVVGQATAGLLLDQLQQLLSRHETARHIPRCQDHASCLHM